MLHERYRQACNQSRPHGSLGYLAPEELGKLVLGNHRRVLAGSARRSFEEFGKLVLHRWHGTASRVKLVNPTTPSPCTIGPGPHREAGATAQLYEAGRLPAPSRHPTESRLPSIARSGHFGGGGHAITQGVEEPPRRIGFVASCACGQRSATLS